MVYTLSASKVLKRSRSNRHVAGAQKYARHHNWIAAEQVSSDGSATLPPLLQPSSQIQLYMSVFDNAVLDIGLVQSNIDVAVVKEGLR